MGPYLEIQNDDLYGYQYKKLFKKIKTVYFIFQPVFNVILTDFRFNVNSWSLLEVPFTPPRNFHPSQCEIVRGRPAWPRCGASRPRSAAVCRAACTGYRWAGASFPSGPGRGRGPQPTPRIQVQRGRGKGEFWTQCCGAETICFGFYFCSFAEPGSPWVDFF